MNTNQYFFSRVRKYFGRQPLFADLNQLQFDQAPNHTLLERNFILKNPVHRSTQLGKQIAWSDCLTENAEMQNHGMNHLEGGWPRDVNKDDEEATLRHRKKIERDDNWVKQLLKCCSQAIHGMNQNSAVNIYQDYFSGADPMEFRWPYGATKCFNYKDYSVEQTAPNRPVVQVAWGPSENESTKILSLHSTTVMNPPKKFCRDFYIWDINNAVKPLLTLSAPSIVTKADYCPKDETLIAGGLKSGMAAIWDARVEGYPSAVCPLESGHVGPVSALTWVQSKTNTEFYTGGGDGSLCFWDGRNMKRPFYRILLDPQRGDQDPNRAHGCSALEFEYTIPIRFMAGTDMGHLFLGNRKGFTPLETFTATFPVMDGPVKNIQRNPTFVKNFLVVGAWCARIWTEESKDFPITQTPPQDSLINCAAWSPSRFSLFCTGHEDGSIRFWDYILSHREPIMTMNEFGSPVLSIAFKQDGKDMLIGTRSMGVYLIKLDELLTRSLHRDKPIIAAMMERELKRVKLLESRAKEVKLAYYKAGRPLSLDPPDLVPHPDPLEYETPSEVTQEEEFKDEEEEDFGKEEAEFAPEEEEYVDPDPEFTEWKNTFFSIVDQEQEKNQEKVFDMEETVFD